MSRKTRRTLAMPVVAAALLTFCASAFAQTKSADPSPAGAKVRVPEPKGRGVISISSRGNGPVTIRQNGKTRVFQPRPVSSVTQGRARSAATRQGRYESPRDVRWLALLRLLESGGVAIHPRLQSREMPDPPRARSRAASPRASSRSNTGSGSITIGRPRSNQ